MVASPNAAPQLMKLRETELIGPVNDDRVRGRNIDAGLNDRRAEKHVVVLLIELAHHALERVFRHLSVGDRDAGLGNQFEQPLVTRLDRVDIVMEEVDLAPALQLTENGFADQRVAFRPYKGLYSQPPLGRRRDHGEVPHAFK